MIDVDLTYSKIDESESENKVLENLREQVELERQIRDNTETEKDIADKEAQLAYLSRDTTGANDLEILNMQKDLDDARQDYTDSLIDQALDQMQTDNEKAQEQRTQMIDRMNMQLQWMNENGVLWDKVHKIMADGKYGCCYCYRPGNCRSENGC